MDSLPVNLPKPKVKIKAAAEHRVSALEIKYTNYKH
jgi:hypothetical protein